MEIFSKMNEDELPISMKICLDERHTVRLQEKSPFEDLSNFGKGIRFQEQKKRPDHKNFSGREYLLDIFEMNRSIGIAPAYLWQISGLTRSLIKKLVNTKCSRKGRLWLYPFTLDKWTQQLLHSMSYWCLLMLFRRIYFFFETPWKSRDELLKYMTKHVIDEVHFLILDYKGGCNIF